MQLYHIHSYSYSPFENLALESAMMNTLPADCVILYLWQNQRTVVIGKNQNPWRECNIALLEEEKGTLARRTTGGGAVYHDLGNLNFSFITSKERYDLHQQLRVILHACADCGIDATFSGRNDIEVDGKKFSGNAFAFEKSASLQHGTLLIDVDIPNLGRYLSPSPIKMQAKGIQSVRARVANLCEYQPKLTIETMRNLLIESFQSIYGKSTLLTKEEFDQAELKSLQDQYASWDWRFGKTMQFDVSFEHRFEWGELELQLQLFKAQVSAVKVYSDAIDVSLVQNIEQALLHQAYGRSLSQALIQGTSQLPHRNQYEDIAQWLSQIDY